MSELENKSKMIMFIMLKGITNRESFQQMSNRYLRLNNYGKDITKDIELTKSR